MKNGVGVAQNIVLFGGTSEIGLEVIRRLVVPGTARLVLVSRDPAAAETAAADIVDGSPDLEVHHVRFDAADAANMPHVVAEIVSAIGDIDVAVVAQGVLREGHDYFADPATVSEVVGVNMTGVIALLYGLADRMRSQGYGKIVLLSSVAGARVRRSNPVYGASKAGVDGFALALDHELTGLGVSILVVRPGFVTTRMTAGMKKAPFSTDAETVAARTVAAMSTDKTVVWVPGALGPMFAILRNLPTMIWRRLPF
ncbi:MAG: SDR family NAD(P)-dependent oxidoreductase [Actinomycetota bacterium]